jgi:hypothetical protein
MNTANPTTAPQAAPLSSKTVARIRRQYAEGVAVARIYAENGVSCGVVYQCVDGRPPGLDALPPLQRRRSPMVALDRRQVVARLWRTAVRRIRDIDRRLADADQPQPERERDARMLAVFIKTLRDLTALDRAQADTVAPKDAPPDDDDFIPRDIEELRRELARRVDLLRQRRTPAGPAGGDGAA